MSADNYMYIRRIGAYYVVSMESASDEMNGGPKDCYKCGSLLTLDAYGTWVTAKERSSFCPQAVDGKVGHFAGGYTRVFDRLKDAWQYAYDEVTEYGVSYSEEVIKELVERI